MPTPSATFAPAPRTILLLLAAVAALSLLGALTSLNDDLRHGVHGAFVLIWLSWLRTSAMLAAFGMLAYWGLGQIGRAHV